jgi:hypothetical protein
MLKYKRKIIRSRASATAYRKWCRGMLTFFEIAYYILILAFGVLITAMFAGVDNTRRNRILVLCLILLLFLAQILGYWLIGYEITAKLYPVMIHIPMTLLIAFYFRRGLTVAFVSVISTYLCCQIPQWAATVALHMSGSRNVYFITYSIVLFPVFFLLKRYVVTSVNRLLTMSKKSALLFGVVPFIYYIFDYGTTTYTDLLFQGTKAAVLFMPSLISIFYFVFIIFHYNEIKRRGNAINERILLSTQMKQAKKDLKEFWEVQEKAAIHRHDMRHHLNLIAGFLTDGDTKKATEYISQVQSNIEEITPIRYCENNTVNLILSYYASKAASDDITFTIDAQFPQNIPIAETELCALLSNGLENAFQACSLVDLEKARTVRFHSMIQERTLKIIIENSFIEEDFTERSLPISNHQEESYGFKSMIMIINKYKGNYTYKAENGIFTLSIVLPF